MFRTTPGISWLSEHKSLLIALVIMGSWLLHLVNALSLDLSIRSPAGLVEAILIQTFLNTGLFITTHDAIHGLVYPGNRTVNDILGAFCSVAYAALPYGILLETHQLHHQAPMSSIDPDFCAIESTGHSATFLRWYRYFIGQYWSGRQFLQLASIVGLFGVGFRISPLNLVLLWGLPLLLSSLQLFYFGTYQPHRGAKRKPGDAVCANKSLFRPWILSLLACYHFSYHQEHHDYPDVPWWGLPALYKSDLDADKVKAGLPSQT